MSGEKYGINLKEAVLKEKYGTDLKGTVLWTKKLGKKTGNWEKPWKTANLIVNLFDDYNNWYVKKINMFLKRKFHC